MSVSVIAVAVSILALSVTIAVAAAFLACRAAQEEIERRVRELERASNKHEALIEGTERNWFSRACLRTGRATVFEGEE